MSEYTDDFMGEAVTPNRITRRLMVEFNMTPEDANGLTEKWVQELGHSNLTKAWHSLDAGVVQPVNH